ncbi:hypothetical protein [uncultured Bifidobacterium sp.]|nr:hypothetical protein [uncultured Bifidobacterium sp.]
MASSSPPGLSPADILIVRDDGRSDISGHRHRGVPSRQAEGVSA